MYTFIADESASSHQIWAAFLALSKLDAAADAVSGAGAMTADLSAESQWRNDGLSPRALRDALDELHGSIVRELSAIRHAQSAVERGISA